MYIVNCFFDTLCTFNNLPSAINSFCLLLVYLKLSSVNTCCSIKTLRASNPNVREESEVNVSPIHTTIITFVFVI